MPMSRRRRIVLIAIVIVLRDRAGRVHRFARRVRLESREAVARSACEPCARTRCRDRRRCSIAHWRWRVSIDGADTFSPGFASDARTTCASAIRIGRSASASPSSNRSISICDCLPLLWHRLDIPALRLVQPTLDFEQRKDGSNTWTFGRPSKDESVGLERRHRRDRVRLRRGQRSPTSTRALDVRADDHAPRCADSVRPARRGRRSVDAPRSDPARRSRGRASACATPPNNARTRERARARRSAAALSSSHGKRAARCTATRSPAKAVSAACSSLANPKPFPVRADIDVGPTVDRADRHDYRSDQSRRDRHAALDLRAESRHGSMRSPASRCRTRRRTRPSGVSPDISIRAARCCATRISRHASAAAISPAR